MCIYLGENSDLHYDSAEHIIPAAIGGKSKLPADFVSREFNQSMSLLEQEFVRKSLVSLARELEGPGKRGRLGQRYETKSPVQVIHDTGEADSFALGYIQKAVPHEIVHYSFNQVTGEVRIVFDKKSEEVPEKQYKQFVDNCNKLGQLRMRKIENDKIGIDVILFGIAEGVEENYSCFLAHHPDNKNIPTGSKLAFIANQIKVDFGTANSQQYIPLFSGTIEFRIDYFRVYAKMAFNYLAQVKGKLFVMDNMFDPVRNWINAGGDNIFVQLDTGNHNPLQSMDIKMPASSHVIFISAVRPDIFAKVFLYGGLSVDIHITGEYKGPSFVNGLICDWKNQAEYTLMEYLTKYLHRQGRNYDPES